MTTTSDTQAAQAHASWRQERHDAVSGPVGNLAMTGYTPIEETPTTIDALSVSVRRSDGDAGAWVTPVEGADVTLDGVPLTGETFMDALRPDGTPLLRCGDLAADVFSLDGTDYEVRLYDPASEKRRNFKEIATYDYDPAFVLHGEFQPYEDADSVQWGFTRSSDSGHTKKVPGTITVTVEGQEYELLAFLDGPMLVLVFADATTGPESYAPGRFMKLPAPGESGPVTIDFNEAFIPPCGFSDYYSCPMPPPQNRIAAAVRAGERRVEWHS